MANYQAQTQSELLAAILTNITPNGMGNISGYTMQEILRNMAITLNGTNYTFPVDPSVTTDDVGKLMMNDGSGYAKVYQLSAPIAQQGGKWSLTPDSFSVFDSNTSISIVMAGNSYTYSRADWDWPTDPPATTVAEELNYLRLFLMGQAQFNGIYNFYQSSDGNTLYIDEVKFQGTMIYVTDFGKFPLKIIQSSFDSLPPAPTAFPLGLLCGLTDNGALISANMIETYPWDLTIPPYSAAIIAKAAASNITLGPFGMLNYLFNYLNPLNLNSNQAVYNFLTQIIIPSNNGTATFFDLSTYQLDPGSILLNQLQFQFLGFALSSTATTVTVYNNKALSFFVSIFIRVVREGILELSSNAPSPFSPPFTGSGSGSGSGL
jgi:hypothetical protein